MILGLNFSIQLKAKEMDANTQFVLVRGIKRSTIHYWLQKLEPIMFCVYIENEREAYWQWIKHNTFDLSKNNQSFQMKVSRENPITKTNWQDIYLFTKKIFANKHQLYDFPPQNLKQNNGWDYYLKNEYNIAISYFEKESENNDPILLNAIAVSYYQIYEYQKALIAINKAIEIDKNIVYLQNKASILTQFGYQQNDLSFGEEANQIYEKIKCLQLDKFIETSSYNYANNLRLLKQYDEALEMYLLHLEYNPNNAEAWKNLGSTYFQVEIHDKELNCYEKALTINPNLIEALFSKGFTLFFFLKEVEGLDFMLQAIKKDKRKYFDIEFPYGYYWIAEAYYSLGNIPKAQFWNNKGYINNPTNLALKTQFYKLK